MRRGHGLIGLLIVLVCILVLSVIGLNALNKSITGQGSPQANTVRSMEDKIALSGLFQSLSVDAMGGRDRYIAPSALTPSGDRADDTTAHVFSALIAKNLTKPKLLISGNEYNPNVFEDPDYDYMAYSPREGTYWDQDFKADLDDESNVSFAHMPLYGDRFKDHWRATLDSTFPLLGNRGPRDGQPDPYSWTYGRDGTWGGHIVYGDGHVDFVTTFTPGHRTVRIDGQDHPDNFYAMEEGPDGGDAILSFTPEMLVDGPTLQYD